MESSAREFIPTGAIEDQKQVQPVAVAAPEQSIEKPNPLVGKLAEVKTNVRAHSEKAIGLVEGKTPEVMMTGQQISPADARILLEELAGNTVIEPFEYLSKSKQALSASSQIIDKATKDQKALQDASMRPYLARRNIDERIGKLDQVKGLRRIPAALEKRRLAAQRAGIDAQMEQLNGQIHAKTQIVDQLSEQEKPVRLKQEELLLEEIAKEVQSVKIEYEKFLQEVLLDGTTTEEIRKAYIGQVISPEVDRIIEERNFPPEQRDKFYSALQKCIDHREEPQEQRHVYRRELDNFFNYDNGFYDLRDVCETLVNGGDKLIVQGLVVDMAVSDMAPIKSAVEPGLKSHDQRSRFSAIFNKAIEPSDRWNRDENAFGGQLLSKLDERHDSGYTNMNLWNAMKSSKVANELFGEVIRERDLSIYNTALDKSLSDTSGGDIDMLYYYPTPDAIRNLVVIAAADSREYRTVHANWSLDSLSKQPNWEQLLDEAEVVHPSLKTARPVLESWNYREYGNRPDIQQAAEGLSLAIFESKPADERLAALATESLPNSAILSILTEKRVIKETDAKTLTEAEGFLKRLSEETWQKHRENDYSVPYVEGYYLRNTLRGALKELMQSNEMTSSGEMVESVGRLTSLSKKILENQSNYPVLNYLVSGEVVETLTKRKVDPELIFQFPEHARALMDEKFKETRSFIFEHSDTLLQNTTDLRFLSNVVGEFGQKADFLIRGYQECLSAGVITTSEKELVLEFARQFRVISPTTLQGYKEAKEAGHEKVYIAQLQALAERMTGSGTITDEERGRPYYKDLLRHVYSNNSGQRSSFESNDSCPDRSNDLTEFKIKPRYEIDLLSQSEIRVKTGEALDATVKEGMQKPILEVAERMNALGHDKEKILAALQESVDKTLQEILQKGGLSGVNLESVATLDEKLFLILTDSIYGSRSVDSGAIKNLIVTYEFATFEDIGDYIAGTRDRVGRANNQDYALLCEVGTFYSDRIKEVNRRLVQAAWNNPAIAAIMPEYFQKLAQDTVVSQQKDAINRLQVDRLGASGGFVKQMGKMLEKRRGRKYPPEEVKNIIQRYESWAGGLTEKSSASPKPETRAFYGQLRSQREKTFDALKIITGAEVDPKEAHLGEIDLQQALATEANIREGKYDEEQFASYTVQRFIDIFEDERIKIEGELAKFESISGKQREVLYGYIAKTKESANARMVGGVCVCGDNPDKHPQQNIWSMPNYLQMVLQEPDTLQCQGLVLLHHFAEGGKKILTASFNPSSTYLYSVDEAALFKGIAGSLEEFATDNGFDMVAVPHNKAIRTNRTGGEFEKAMDRKISEVGKTHNFETVRQFSYHPSYQLQEMDLIWERKTA